MRAPVDRDYVLDIERVDIAREVVDIRCKAELYARESRFSSSR
jgi:hypothetical protein